MVILGINDRRKNFIVELNDVNHNLTFEFNRYLNFDVPLIDIAIDKYFIYIISHDRHAILRHSIDSDYLHSAINLTHEFTEN